jgi:carbon-monoxide dehydrogenase medium subunit
LTRPQYRRADTRDEATTLLTKYGLDAAVLSGGQTLLAMMSAGLAAPAVLVDINQIDGAGRLDRHPNHVVLGSAVRHRQLELCDDELARAVPLLRPAARLISHIAVRNRGTFVGSIAHADPAAEWPAVAVATEAVLTLARLDTERTIGAGEFFLGPMTTSREPEELVVSASIPTAPPRSGAAVCELAYRAGDYAVVGVAAQVSLVEDAIADARIALFGVDATPIRARSAERVLVDHGAAAIAEAAHLAQSSANPIDDATASAAYRRAMIPVFTQRAIRQALDQTGAT